MGAPYIFGFHPFAFAQSVSQAPSLPPAILIVDGSGSMWGRIGRSAKISIVKDVFPNTLQSLPKEVPLGIMAYGHRRKSNCRDIELIVPPSFERSRHIAAVKSLLPRGKTPITGALEAAAQALESSKQPATIILLSDGVENCRRDPCAMARKLAARSANQSAKLKIHVISFGLAKEKTQTLRCISDATGGRFMLAGDKTALDHALRQTFAALRPQATSQAKAPPPKPVEMPPELHLSAVLKPGGQPLEDDITWFVSPLFGTDQKVTQYIDPQPVLKKIKPGKYYVEARYGQVRMIRKVTVAPKGITNVQMVLNAGELHITMDRDIRTAARDRLIITLSREMNGKLREIDRRTDGRASYKLPAGTYLVSVESGRAKTTQKVKLEAGTSQQVTLSPQIAVLRLRAVATPGGKPLEEVSFFVTAFTDHPATGERHNSLPANAQPVAHSASANPVFHLKPGIYEIRAVAGQAEIRKRITLTTGDDRSLSLPLNAGEITVKATVSGAAGRRNDGLQYHIYQLPPKPEPAAAEKPGRKILQTAAPAAKLILPKGRYRIEARAGFINVSAAKTIELNAGDALDVNFALEAAILQPVLRQKHNSAPLRHVLWRIFDQRGRELYFTSEPIPKLLLAPGHYRIEAEHRGQITRQAAKVQAGEQKRLDILSGGHG